MVGSIGQAGQGQSQAVLQRIQQRRQASQLSNQSKGLGLVQRQTVQPNKPFQSAVQSNGASSRADSVHSPLLSDRVSSNRPPQRTSGLGGLKARKAVTPVQQPRTSAPTLDTLPVNAIQSVAEQSGFVGVTEQDIIRAYTQGSSLMVDTAV